MEDEQDFAAGFGGPGPEDLANGAAVLAAGLVREARELAQAAAALRAAAQPGPDGVGDVRRLRLALQAAGEAAMRAALALDGATLLGEALPTEALARRLAETAMRAGVAPGTLAPLLRAAALVVGTDDGAARIAASTLAAGICSALTGTD
jgi:hypothetical protein